MDVVFFNKGKVAPTSYRNVLNKRENSSVEKWVLKGDVKPGDICVNPGAKKRKTVAYMWTRITYINMTNTKLCKRCKDDFCVEHARGCTVKSWLDEEPIGTKHCTLMCPKNFDFNPFAMYNPKWDGSLCELKNDAKKYYALPRKPLRRVIPGTARFLNVFYDKRKRILEVALGDYDTVCLISSYDEPLNFRLWYDDENIINYLLSDKMIKKRKMNPNKSGGGPFPNM